ncbi:MAG: molybdopterin molybdotransferase MoeA [Gammaproteobacteria bacterium]|nr:molybdopterin molybdotransferase MoeA [Gammaproteobacteria bacterium]
MLTLSEAQREIFSKIKQATQIEKVTLAGLANRFLAKDVSALVSNPAFDNSAMDGYALRSADAVVANTILPLKGEASCGMEPGNLAPGTTMRIFTGAPLPAGADAVEIQENIRTDHDNICFPESITINQNIRRKGEDFEEGQLLYEKGRQLLPMDSGLIASAGIAQLPVFKKPRVLVIATGNELITPGKPLKPGQIYESNKLTTLLQLNALGAEAVDGGTVDDNPQALREQLAESTRFDFIITSGGASVGDHDLVKQVFAELGTIDLWRVKIKPGKPVAFGLVGDKTHFFALPGNPVSSLVTFKLFVEPALYHWHHSRYLQLELNAIASNSFNRQAGRMEFLRTRLFTEHGILKAEVLSGQGSHMLGTIRHTNGLVRVKEDSIGFKLGETVSVIPLHFALPFAKPFVKLIVK